MRVHVALAAVAAAFSFAVPASAAQVYITYTGKVGFAQNYQGTAFGAVSMFGLTGMDFRAVYTLTLPTPGAYQGSSDVFVETYGSGAANPVKGVLTINGVSQQFGQASGSAFLRSSPGLVDTIQFDARNSLNNSVMTANDDLGMNVSSFTQDFVSVLDFTQPFTYVTQPGDQRSSSFFISRYLFATAQTTYVYGTLDIARVTVSNVAPPVPEPATWAMMLGGFGAVGYAMRRRRTVMVRAV